MPYDGHVLHLRSKLSADETTSLEGRGAAQLRSHTSSHQGSWLASLLTPLVVFLRIYPGDISHKEGGRGVAPGWLRRRSHPGWLRRVAARMDITPFSFLLFFFFFAPFFSFFIFHCHQAHCAGGNL